MAIEPRPVKDGHVRVLVRARQVVEYQQIREITVADWQRYNEMTEGAFDDEDYDRAFGGLIDPLDVLDAEGLEDFELERLGEDFKPLPEPPEDASGIEAPKAP